MKLQMNIKIKGYNPNILYLEICLIKSL
jgi:hypothetical protein